MKRLSVFALFLTCMVSCKPDKGVTPGKGGSATVNVYLQHHTIAKRLVNCKVYIRYNTLDAPTSGVYDDSMVCINHDSLVSCSFTGLQNGNYYFYGKGYDTSISQAVKGGLPYTISSQTVQDFDLPVSE